MNLLIHEKEHTVHLDLADKLPQLTGDIHEIHRAMREILLNAVQYTPNRGEIFIHTRHEQDSLLIQIRDTGYGISEKDFPHIFDRFFRADQARTISGVGLGLAIVRKVIEYHDGDIVVDSHVNLGTTVTIRLPLHQPQPT